MLILLKGMYTGLYLAKDGGKTALPAQALAFSNGFDAFQHEIVSQDEAYEVEYDFSVGFSGDMTYNFRLRRDRDFVGRVAFSSPPPQAQDGLCGATGVKMVEHVGVPPT